MLSRKLASALYHRDSQYCIVSAICILDYHKSFSVFLLLLLGKIILLYFDYYFSGSCYFYSYLVVIEIYWLFLYLYIYFCLSKHPVGGRLCVCGGVCSISRVPVGVDFHARVHVGRGRVLEVRHGRRLRPTADTHMTHTTHHVNLSPSHRTHRTLSRSAIIIFFIRP